VYPKHHRRSLEVGLAPFYCVLATERASRDQHLGSLDDILFVKLSRIRNEPDWW